METATAPAYLLKLEEEFRKTHSEDLAPVCRWLGIPHPSDCPTPGDARQWKKDEWGEWADKNGFEYDGQATHSWNWRHKIVDTILISVAKTPGDWRTPMAVATQMRARVRNVALAATAIIRGTLEVKDRPEIANCSEEVFKARLIAQVKNYHTGPGSGEPTATNLLVNKAINEQAKKGIGSHAKTIADARSLLNLCAENGQPGREVLFDMLGPEEGERYWNLFKLAAPESPITLSFFDDLKDRLELLKETRRAEKEQKRLEREAKEAAAAAALAERQRPRTTQELAQTQVDVVHNANLKTLDGVILAGEAAMRTVGSVLDRARLARQNLAKATLTGIEDTGPLKADLAATRQENAILSQSRDEAAAKVEALLVQVEEEKAKQVDPNTIKKLQEDKDALLAVVGLIGDAYTAVQKAGPFEIVRILEDLANNAREAIKNHG